MGSQMLVDKNLDFLESHCCLQASFLSHSLVIILKLYTQSTHTLVSQARLSHGESGQIPIRDSLLSQHLMIPIT